ncbi:MAG: hypothetical protein IPH28_19885 [Cytophagaceae bacterium]|nr:hypothetical protein [Cytophagaceae bacterium]
MLARIQLTHNNYILETERFKNKYNKAMSILKKVISSEDYNEMLKIIPFNYIDEIYQKFPITEETTINYIAKIKGYLDGSSQEESFRSLLIFQYLENPTNEFGDNFTNLFNDKPYKIKNNVDYKVS